MEQARDRKSVRWFILLFSFLTLFGPYYCYDLPAANLNALKIRFGVPSVVSNTTTPAQRSSLEEFNRNYGLLYSLFSFPNIILPLVSGVLMDLVGVPVVAIITAVVCLVGQAMFTAGIQLKWWWLMMAGRGVFGIGAESMFVTQTTMLAMWFDSGMISLAMSAVLVSTRASSVANSLIGPLLSSPVTASSIGVYLSVLSCVAAFALRKVHNGPKEKKQVRLEAKLVERVSLYRFNSLAFVDIDEDGEKECQRSSSVDTPRSSLEEMDSEEIAAMAREIGDSIEEDMELARPLLFDTSNSFTTADPQEGTGLGKPRTPGRSKSNKGTSSPNRTLALNDSGDSVASNGSLNTSTATARTVDLKSAPERHAVMVTSGPSERALQRGVSRRGKASAHLTKSKMKPSCTGQLSQILVDVKSFSSAYWALCVVCCFGFTSVSSLSNIAPAYLQHFNAMRKLAPEPQEIINLKFSSMNLTVLLLSPIAGRMIDKFKKYFVFMFTGMVISFAMLLGTAVDSMVRPTVLLVVSSAGQAIFAAAIWPTIPLFVSESAKGTAYGLFVSVQNLGLSAGAAAVAAIQPPKCNNSYMCSMTVLTASAGIAAMFVVIAGMIHRVKRLERRRKNGGKKGLTVQTYEMIDTVER